MDLFEAILKRRSIRKYKAEPIPWDMVTTCIHAGRHAACAGNIFNVRFLVVKGDEQRQAMAEACSEQHWMQDAPIHLVVVAETAKMERYYGTRGARIYNLQNSAAAIENILLAATALGLGSCWIGAFDEDAVKGICNIPPHIDVHAVITLGYADEHPDVPPKRPMEEITNFGGWHGRIEAPKTGIDEWTPYLYKALGSAKEGITKPVNKASGSLWSRLKAEFKRSFRRKK